MEIVGVFVVEADFKPTLIYITNIAGLRLSITNERGSAMLFTIFNYDISIHTCNFGSITPKYGVSIRKDYPDTWVHLGSGVTLIVSKISKDEQNSRGAKEA